MKTTLLFILLLSVQFVNAQNSLELTPLGLTPVGNKEAKYIVFEKPGSQQELYNCIKSFIVSRFQSPKDVMTENSPESIALNAVADGIIVKKGFGYLDVNTNYTIVFHFKDGKIRVDLPSINRMTALSSSTVWQITINQQDPTDLVDHFYVFDKKGELKNESAKSSIEKYFNNFLKDAIEFKAPANENW